MTRSSFFLIFMFVFSAFLQLQSIFFHIGQSFPGFSGPIVA